MDSERYSPEIYASVVDSKSGSEPQLVGPLGKPEDSIQLSWTGLKTAPETVVHFELHMRDNHDGSHASITPEGLEFAGINSEIIDNYENQYDMLYKNWHTFRKEAKSLIYSEDGEDSDAGPLWSLKCWFNGFDLKHGINLRTGPEVETEYSLDGKIVLTADANDAEDDYLSSDDDSSSSD